MALRIKTAGTSLLRAMLEIFQAKYSGQMWNIFYLVIPWTQYQCFCLGCRPYARIADVLSVNVGLELLKIVPGRVSTEVDAHLSYDTQKTVDKVRLTSKVFVTQSVQKMLD